MLAAIKELPSADDETGGEGAQRREDSAALLRAEDSIPAAVGIGATECQSWKAVASWVRRLAGSGIEQEDRRITKAAF